MRRYEDPQKHFERSIERSAGRYVDGLNRAGLKPNARLTRAMAERAWQEARNDYTKQAKETHESNIRDIMRKHDQNLKQIKREGASLRLKTCPLIAALFGATAWYNFSQHRPDSFAVGILFTIGALAFLAMLVLGAIFDR